MNRDLFKAREGLVVQELDGEVVILDQDAGRVHQLNSTASFVWDRLDGQTPLRSIVEGLCERFDVEYETARRDAETIMDRFREAELLEPGETAGRE